MSAKQKARFIDPMLLLKTEALPESTDVLYELKLDGYRAIAFKTGRKVHLRSRNDNDFAIRYPTIATALQGLPEETVIDGEVVAVDADGKPSFSLLQNYSSSSAPLLFYAFDVMILGGKDVMGEGLETRRGLLETKVLPRLDEPIRYSAALGASLSDLIRSVKAHGFEGLVGKHRNSRYEPGRRSGAWMKMRVNRGQEFVIGGYTRGGTTFDAVVFGYHDHGKLIYAARTRNGFTPRTREELMKRFRKLETDQCPFANLPEKHAGRWGAGLTATKMRDCQWLKPLLVGQFEFVEWTDGAHLRHSKFIGLREDKDPKEVVKE